MRKTAKIYYTSDVHGYLFPSAYTERSEKPAGLLNCIANYQKDGNTLVLDGGDTLQGSPMAIYLSAGRKEGLEAEHAIADVFNAGGYDAVTLGNHDFNFGYEYLEHHLNALNARCICANVRDRKGRLGVISSQVFTMENGLRLGVTGVVTDFVNVWEQPEHMRDLEVTDAFSAAERELECLKAISDVTVCIYHGGYECDLETGDLLSESGENVGCRILRELDFDVLLTAHQHMMVPVRKISGTTTLQLPAMRSAMQSWRSPVRMEKCPSRPRSIRRGRFMMRNRTGPCFRWSRGFSSGLTRRRAAWRRIFPGSPSLRWRFRAPG